MTGHAILTPVLMVILITTGDFLSMSSATDNVRPSAKPNTWRIDNLTIAGIALGITDLMFCSVILAIGKFELHLATAPLQTLAAVTLVFSGQAVFYVARERRRLWSSRPSRWLVLSSVADIAIIVFLATSGLLMSALPARVVGGVLAAAFVFTFVLDSVKMAVYARLKMV